ncbi:MAG: sigma factor-like helix-turn-helix DNA-binding protein [Planctomycetota bacterium]
MEAKHQQSDKRIKHSRTQDEVAQLLGVSRSAVYLAEQRAFRKIKQAVQNDPCLRQLAIDVGALPESEALR